VEQAVFEIYAKLLEEQSGIIISTGKEYLLESRVLPIAKEHGFDDLDGLLKKLHPIPDQKVLLQVVEAMTTNETSFFRDSKPFDSFKDVLLPYFMKARATTRKLRIWSAACSSGQEPYSLAMLIKEQGAILDGWDIEIVATDLSNDILDKAKAAEYSQFEVQRGLPVQYLVKYFEQNEDKWCLKDDIKNMITFKQFNLLNSYAGMGPFDMIFCRNVLIYFDAEVKSEIMQKFSSVFADDGVLVLGGAETIIGISDHFKLLPDQRGVFILKDGKFSLEKTG